MSPSRRRVTRSHPNMDPRGTRPQRAAAIAPSQQPKSRKFRSGPPDALPKESTNFWFNTPFCSEEQGPHHLIGNPPVPPRRQSDVGPYISTVSPHKVVPPSFRLTPKQHHSARSSLCQRGTRLGYATAPAGRWTHLDERGCLSPIVSSCPKAPLNTMTRKRGADPSVSALDNPEGLRNPSPDGVPTSSKLEISANGAQPDLPYLPKVVTLTRPVSVLPRLPPEGDWFDRTGPDPTSPATRR